MQEESKLTSYSKEPSETANIQQKLFLTEKKHLYFRCCFNITLHFDQICYIHFLYCCFLHFQSPSFHSWQLYLVQCDIECVQYFIVCWCLLVGSSSVWVETDCLSLWSFWVALVLFVKSKFCTILSCLKVFINVSFG